MDVEVIRTERGWAGHFCCAHDCLFRRNTLLQYFDTEIVVSTVGLMRDPFHINKNEMKFVEIGYGRYYETMAFHSNRDERYHDIDVSKQINFESPWRIDKVDADDLANEMHEKVVEEITEQLKRGNRYGEVEVYDG